MFSGLLPFHNLPGMTAALRVLHAQRPPRPTSAECRLAISDNMWSLIQQCWAQAASDRPPMQFVFSKLNAEGQSTVTLTSGAPHEDVTKRTTSIHSEHALMPYPKVARHAEECIPVISETMQNPRAELSLQTHAPCGPSRNAGRREARPSPIPLRRQRPSHPNETQWPAVQPDDAARPRPRPGSIGSTSSPLTLAPMHTATLPPSFMGQRATPPAAHALGIPPLHPPLGYSPPGVQSNFGNIEEVGSSLRQATVRYQDRDRQRALPANEHSPDVVFEPAHFDPDHDRGSRAAENMENLFADIFGCEDIVKKLLGYQKVANSVKARGTKDFDLRDYIPTNFVFLGSPGTSLITLPPT
jgi:hypothetical protein